MSPLGSLVCFPKDDPFSTLKRVWNWFALRGGDGCTPSLQQATVCHRCRPCRSLTNSCLLGAKAVLLGTGKHSKAVSAQPPCAAPSAKAGGARQQEACAASTWAVLADETTSWVLCHRATQPPFHPFLLLSSLLEQLLPCS